MNLRILGILCRLVVLIIFLMGSGIMASELTYLKLSFHGGSFYDNPEFDRQEMIITASLFGAILMYLVITIYNYLVFRIREREDLQEWQEELIRSI